MKRPMLVTGVTAAITYALLLFFGKSAVIIAAAFAVSVLILYFIKPLKLKKYILLPTISAGILCACVFCFCFNTFRLKPALKFDGKSGDIHGTVTEISPYYDDLFTVTLKCDDIGGEKSDLKLRIDNVSSEELPELYDYCSVKGGSISTIRGTNGNIDYSSASDGIFLTASHEQIDVLWESEHDLLYYCAKLRQAVSERLGEYLSENIAGLVNGMLFGDKSGISAAVLNNFRTSGVSHLLAVSGLHTSLWCGLLILLLKLLKVPEKIRGIICFSFLVFFCALSSFSPSVVRASIMTAAVLAAPFFKREADSLNSLGLSAFFILAVNPYAIFSVSFLLSFSATFGVIESKRAEERLETLLKKVTCIPLRRVLRYVADSVIVSIFAAVFTLPVSACFFRVFSLVAPLTNLAAVKLAFYALITSVIALVLSCINVYFVHSVTIFVFKISSVLINAVIKITAFFGNLRFSSVPLQKEFLFTALLIIFILCAAGYTAGRHGNSFFKKMQYILCPAALAVSVVLPLLPYGAGRTLTVIPQGNSVAAVIRCGTQYAFFCSDTLPKHSQCSEYLPAATIESLEYLYMNDVSNKSRLEQFSEAFAPQTTVLTPYAYSKISDSVSNTTTLIKNGGDFTLGSQINFKTVDTYGMRCVIIETPKTKIIISLDESNDIDKITKNFGNADIIIMNENAEITSNTPTGILCCDASVALSQETFLDSASYEKFYTTAESGVIKLFI